MLVFYDTDSSGWPVIPLTESDPVTRTPVPEDLEGLIIFTSTKDHSKGEIYSFNPQTGAVTRLTDNDMYEGTISLSHDRTKVAFMGASGNPEKNITYANECEIYILTIADGTLEQLTTNGYLDGHPAWSPDDTKIVFACYNPANWGGHIMLIDLSLPEGNPARLKDLTLLSEPSATDYWCDENDPEFTPAGKIVYKTNRYAQAEYYSANSSYFTYPDSYVLHIALMNSDGSNPVRITDKSNVVDHDPVSNAAGMHTVFERLPGDYNYLEIPGCFGPWDIVEAKLDGSCDENILVNDPWLNWLPVYDPTGKYIVYFRSCGYTETRLIRRSDKKDLGRFIPGITKIDYLDWK